MKDKMASDTRQSQIDELTEKLGLKNAEMRDLMQ